MLAPERREKILEEVMRNKSALVKDLCVRFGVTSETIRKDLNILAKQGKLLKTHGGAYVHEGVDNEIHAILRKSLLPKAKMAIANICAARVQSGETIMLDESTTAVYIAKALRNLSRLTIITNSLHTANVLADCDNIRIILCGGRFSHRNQCFTGSETVAMLRRYHADQSFVSCRGMDLKVGITDSNTEGGLIRQMMLEQADKSTLVLDNTKLDHAYLYCIGSLALVDTVVADTYPKIWEETFAKAGVEHIKALPG